MELPTYHIPTLRGLLLATWERLSVFLLRVGKVIIAASVIITLLASFSPSGQPLAENEVGESVLGSIGKAITPVFHPMGITDENWPAAVGLLSGVVVKEIVVGTLNGVYSRMDAGDAASEPATNKPFDFFGDLKAAVATIPANAEAFARGFFDPLGFGAIGQAQTSNLQQAAEQQNIDTVTLTRMGSLFSESAAVAYLIFILLYIPCVNTMAAIYRETRSRAWTLFAIAWGVGLAYSLAVLYYQFSHFGEHPLTALGWLVGVLALLIVVILALRRIGLHRATAAQR